MNATLESIQVKTSHGAAFINVFQVNYGLGIVARVYAAGIPTYLHKCSCEHTLMQFVDEECAKEWRAQNPEGTWTRLDEPRPTQEPKP